MNPNSPQAVSAASDPIIPNRQLLLRLAAGSTLVILLFSLPLYRLVGFALHSDLYSHILLIPIVSIYLIWAKRRALPSSFTPDYLATSVFIALGLITLIISMLLVPFDSKVPLEDYLAGKSFSLLLFLFGIAAWALGRSGFRSLMFPLGFLIFIVPFPALVRSEFEVFLQHGSAQVALAMFKIAGTSVFYHDLLFQLRGISLEVAPECSGLHSSLALFITSVIAGQFFLRNSWSRVLLTAAVIPLALLRNGFRIFTLGELCVHVSPDMIDSYIHHQGGPIFFLLSLIPFFFLLRFLHKNTRQSA